MKCSRLLLPSLFSVTSICAPALSAQSLADSSYAPLAARINDYILDKDARIGVGLIVNGRDTVEVNGRRDFPMLSVYKFPQALAVADYCQRNGISFSDSIDISPVLIKDNTWSPLREKYGRVNLRLPISELLAFSLQQSDNNACDILFDLIDAPSSADSLMTAYGFPDIRIINTEAQMHEDVYLCYQNRTTPVAISALTDRFNLIAHQEGHPLWHEIGQMMETCDTGADRIIAPLTDKGAIVGHKTGTGDRNSQGRLIGVNDVAYVNMPDGQRYSLSVFISDAACSVSECAAIIAGISDIVYATLSTGNDLLPSDSPRHRK